MKRLKLLNILLATLLSFGAFLFTRPLLVSALSKNVGVALLPTYTTEVKVDENGFSQIVIKDESGKITYLTDDNFTHASPVIEGNTVVWMSQFESTWQIFMHKINTGKTMQLTSTGNNVNPKVSGEYVAWEGFKDGIWQIFLFDGMKIKQITSDKNPKQDVSLDGNLLSYAKKDTQGWQIYLYNIERQSDEKLSERGNNRKPFIKDNVVVWETGEKEGPVSFEYDLSSKTLKKLVKTKEKAVVAGDSTSMLDNKDETTQPKTEIAGDTKPEEIITVDEIKKELKINEQETPESTQSSSELPQEIINGSETPESTNSTKND
jgi:beta propeller repeat protein